MGMSRNDHLQTSRNFTRRPGGRGGHNALLFKEPTLFISLGWEGGISPAQTCPPARPRGPPTVLRRPSGGRERLHLAAGPTKEGLTSSDLPDVPPTSTITGCGRSLLGEGPPSGWQAPPQEHTPGTKS